MADRQQAPQGTTNLVEYTVSELAFALKRTVEDAFGLVRLRGEISGFKGPHASGHCYFTLKDENASIEAVIWRSTYQRLKFKPEAGLEIIARGRVTTYPDKSKYQIVIDDLEPAGAGALMALMEARKKQLAAEGLFDEARKLPLPFLPRVIGVVTSPTGAVIRDILHRLSDRFPSHVLVWPVRVQGETCALEVSAAIEGLNTLGALAPRPDLIIVARGGGSLEDLWGFNEEIVVRAAAASAIPLISAVGHETDWTLIDLVADFRAPTPTAAAERAVPVRADLMTSVNSYGLRVVSCLRRHVDGERRRFTATTRGLQRKGELLALPRQRFDTVSARLSRALVANARAHGTQLHKCASRLKAHLIARAAERARERLRGLDRGRARALGATVDRSRRRLDASGKLLGTLGYHNVLARGFALIRDADGNMIRRAADVTPDTRLDIEFADGHVGARADGAPHDAPPREKSAEPTPLRPKQQKARAKEDQGTLL